MSTNVFLRTFLPRTNRTLTLATEAGQVVCPRRGVIDIENCFACSCFRGPAHAEPEMIVCSPTVTPALAHVPTGFVPR